VNDPIMGLIIDKTHSRWGKCRPYFLWMSVPMGVIMVLAFTVPEFSPQGKLVYAYVTFTLLGMIYTAINIPVTAILPRLSADIHERTVFGTFRMIGAMIASVAASVITLPLIKTLGKGSPAAGYRNTMLLYGVITTALFLVTFFNLKELNIGNESGRDKEDRKTPDNSSITNGLKAAKGNLPWLLVFLYGAILQMTLSMRGAAAIYYCKYYLLNEDIFPLLSALPVVMLISYSLLPFVTQKIGKRNTVLSGGFITLLGCVLIISGGKSLVTLFAGTIISALGLAFGLGLAFVLIADTVDYGEWKNGVRSEGFLSAASSFGGKLGVGLGSALTAWILGFGGYVPNALAQSESAIAAIKFVYLIMPVIGTLIGMALMFFYKVDNVAAQMQNDLLERHTS
jgi:GPH family glycoside/pentoside/hexuronide:cation symporter